VSVGVLNATGRQVRMIAALPAMRCPYVTIGFTDAPRGQSENQTLLVRRLRIKGDIAPARACRSLKPSLRVHRETQTDSVRLLNDNRCIATLQKNQGAPFEFAKDLEPETDEEIMIFVALLACLFCGSLAPIVTTLTCLESGPSQGHAGRWCCPNSGPSVLNRQ